MATRSEVKELLEQMKVLVEAGRVTFVPRDVNVRGMAQIGITNREAEATIARLTENNYVRGPEPDLDGSEQNIWIFGASVEKTLVYIKFKIEQGRGGDFVKCLSFHPAQYELHFPLRLRTSNQKLK